MTRLAPALVLAGVALVGAAGAASATGHHDKPDTTHRAVCHPKAGGWVLINPAQASSHIDESTGLPKHSHDGRVDVYATNGVCPPTGSPTTIPTTTPTEVPSSQPTTTAPRPTATVTVTAPPTSQPTSPSPTSSTHATTTTTTGHPSSVGPRPTSIRPSARSSAPSSHKPNSTNPYPASPRRSAPSSTVAPPEQLAHTGFNATALAVIGAGLLAAGIAVSRKNGAHR